MMPRGRALVESRARRAPRYRIAPAAYFLCVLAPFVFFPVLARATPVDLALVLAVDVSDSIDAEEVRLQRQGYMAAMQHPRTLHAIKRGRHGRIAVAYFEWADAEKQMLIVDWMTIADAASARAFANRLRPAPVLNGYFTSISAALAFATALFQRAEFETKRRVIDLSGDGKNNNGPPLAQARARALSKGITINGLPIINPEGDHYGGMPPLYVDRYYKKRVIGGSGAFIVVVKRFSDFEEAINRKLLREIAAAPSQAAVARAP
jgi:hypothetical protein